MTIKELICWFCVLHCTHIMASELYSQISQLGEYGSVSSFASNRMEDVQAADDFTVPTGQFWEIRALRFLGGHVDCRYGVNLESFSVNIYIYEDENSLPGLLVASLHQQDYFILENTWAVNFDTPLQLQPGTYWISYQWFVGDEICNRGIRTREGQDGLPYSWQNGGVILGISDCITWGAGMACNSVLYDPNLHPDLAFALYDERLFVPTEIPTLSRVGFLFFVGLVLSCSLLVNRKIRKQVQNQ